MQLIESILEEPRKTFTDHLDDENNVRILFSGAYGSGKTTFLDDYFKKKTQEKIYKKEKFKTIHLYPVSYPAASNEDIFKYIKYDILYHLIVDYELVLIEEDINFITKLPGLLIEHIDKIISTFLLFIPESNSSGISGDDASKAFEVLASFKTSLSKLLSEKKPATQPNTTITNFLRDINDAEGSIYEENVITQLIYVLIQKLKFNNIKEEAFQTILIIDDLDRIDPHHIFRLFNVFAAHFDTRRELPNKFGFDKVMFVCDINNIRNIYKSNYGTGADFTGYIDKFYSKQIFKFSNKESVKKAVKSVVIKSLKYKGQDEDLTNFLSKETHMTEDIEKFLSAFVENNSINLRALFRYLENEPVPVKYKDLYFDSTIRRNWQFTSVLIFDILLNIFGDIDAVEAALENSSESYSSEVNYNNNYRVGNALTILGFQEHKFSEIEYKISFPKVDYCLQGVLKRRRGRYEDYWTENVKVFSTDGIRELDIKPNIF